MANRKEKGDSYELAVINEVERWLKTGQLPFPSTNIKIFHKKKYPLSSGNDIEVDISLEIYRPTATQPTQIVIFECKNYNSPIGTKIYNEFHDKFNKIHAHKGYIFTTSRFQEGVLKEGLSDHIGLVRFIPGEEPIFDVERNGMSPRDLFFYELKNCNTISNHFVSLEWREGYSNFASFFYRQVLELKESSFIPYISEDEFERLTLELREKRGLGNLKLIPDENLIDLIQEAGYDFVMDMLPHNNLGLLNFKDKKVAVDLKLEFGSPIWRFTLAHELGHAILHQQYFEMGLASVLSDSDSIYLTQSDTDRIEIQANLFASFLLMPKKGFVQYYLGTLQNLGIKKNFPKFYVDNQPVNQRDFYNLLRLISDQFCISKRMVEVRLSKMGLLIDKRNDARRIDKF